MRIGSLFSGIGGLELGLERAGVGHTVWQVEQNEYCRAVLARHCPNAQRFDDVRTVGAHNLEPVDVMCGGFPCQDISYANPKGDGLDGTRSGLWWEYARVVREVGPQFVVVENVAALLTRGIGDVLGTLADLGYDAEWSCIQAIDVGAPHWRDRIFIVAHAARDLRRASRNDGPATPHGRGAHLADDSRSGRRARGQGGPDSGGARPAEQALSPVADSERIRRDEVEQSVASGTKGEGPAGATEHCSIASGRGWWATEPDLGRVAHGVPARVDRLRALGNAVVPAVAEVVGRRLLEIAREAA